MSDVSRLGCNWKQANQAIHGEQSYAGPGPGGRRTLVPRFRSSQVSREGLRGLTNSSTVLWQPGLWIEGSLENSVPRGIIYPCSPLHHTCNIIPTPWPLQSGTNWNVDRSSLLGIGGHFLIQLGLPSIEESASSTGGT